MAYAQGQAFRGIIWLILVVFYIQTLNPVMLGYAPRYGTPATPPTEAMTGSFGQSVLDWLIPTAQAAEPAKSLPSSLVFVQRDYVPAYAQPQANGDPLLASTPEFDLADPYLVEKAAELGHDPQRIFAFVRDQIGFESYVGSLRGARGTLWSNAGNALDQASLLIALLRIAGIPARYAQGTLAKDKAQELIASMFLPAPYRVVGFVPDDAEKSDPVNDPALIAEASQHFWVEFQQGGGFTAADPAFQSAELRQTLTGASGQFAEVPNNLRHKVAVRLLAETGGNAFDASLQKQTVLNQTFTSAELVGKPLSIGHFVNSSGKGGLLGANYTHTYSPYLLVGQNDGDISDDPIIRGQDYQEFISSIFGSLANSVVTGVFLEMDVIQPGGQKETFERALVDRVGFAARSYGNDNNLSLNTPEQPAFDSSDVVTIAVVQQDYYPIEIGVADQIQSTQASLKELGDQLSKADLKNPTLETQQKASQYDSKFRNLLTLLTLDSIPWYLDSSDLHKKDVSQFFLTKTYFEKPWLLITRMKDNKFSMDAMNTGLRFIPFPNQTTAIKSIVQFFKGFHEIFDKDFTESIFNNTQETKDISTVSGVFSLAKLQGISNIFLTKSDLSKLETLSIPEDIKLRVISQLTT